MVTFPVVGYDEVNLLKIYLLLQILHKVKSMRRPYRVDQNSFLILALLTLLQ